MPLKEKTWEKYFYKFLSHTLVHSNKSDDKTTNNDNVDPLLLNVTLPDNEILQEVVYSPKPRRVSSFTNVFSLITEELKTSNSTSPAIKLRLSSPLMFDKDVSGGSTSATPPQHGTPSPKPTRSPSFVVSSEDEETSLEVKLRMTFTEYHNDPHFAADAVSAFLGDVSSMDASFYHSEERANTSLSRGIFKKAFSLVNMTDVEEISPCMIAMPKLSDKSLPKETLSLPITRRSPSPPGVKILDNIPLNAWIIPYIVAAAQNYILQFLENIRSINPAFRENRIFSISDMPIFLSSFCYITKVLISKDPSWRPWVERTLLICDNYLFELDKNISEIAGFANLLGSQIINTKYVVPNASDDMSALCISCLSMSDKDSPHHTFWVRSIDTDQMPMLEEAIRQANDLSPEKLYKFSKEETDESAEGTLGKGRYNIVKVGARIPRKALSPHANSPFVKKYIRSTLERTESMNSLSSFNYNSRSSLNDSRDEDEVDTFVVGFQDDITVGSNESSAAQIQASDFNALKLVSKDIFWRRVKSGSDRPDALAREVLTHAWVWHVAQMRLNNPMDKYEHDIPIVKLCGVYESIDGFVMELELMEKLDLYEKLVADGVFNEQDAKQIIRQLIDSIVICNNAGIAHRDVKLSNITFPVPNTEDKGKASELKVRLADFGMAGFMDPITKKLHGRCGTPGYVAPDILNAKVHEGYSIHVDLFSVGVVAYTLLCGYEPFYGTDDQELIRVNKSVEYQFHLPEWGGISMSAKDFIANCLLPHADHRMTAEEAKNHPWLATSVL